MTVALCSLLSCAKSEIGETVAPDINISRLSNAVAVDDNSETTAWENYILRLDAEAKGNYRLTDEEAVSTVLSFASGGVGSSSGIQPFSTAGIDIKGIAPLRNRPVMLAAKDDRSPVTPLVVEFDGPEGEGFAVCSGDKRYEKVFCYVPKGDIADTAKIEMLKHFYRSVEYDINDSIARFNAQIDSLHALGRNATYSTSTCKHGSILYNGMFCMGEEYDEMDKYEKYLYLRIKWGQLYPYNKYMEIGGSDVFTHEGHVAVGCIPVAVGQAMAFKKYNYYNYITPAMWNNINSMEDVSGTIYEDVVAKYLSEISYGMNPSFSQTGTSVKNGDLKNYLDKLVSTHGLKYDLIKYPQFNTFQEKESISSYIKNAINNNNILLLGANSSIDNSLAHSFVVDGAKYSMGTLYEIIGTEYEGGVNVMRKLLNNKCTLWVNCNWGWNGSSDGLYDYENLKPDINRFYDTVITIIQFF